MAASEMQITPQPISRSWAPDLLTSLCLAMIIACAIYLRFVALDYGMPLVYGDENPIVEHAVAISLSDPNPHMFYYGSLTFYIFKLVTFAAQGLSTLCFGAALTLPNYIEVLRYLSAFAGLVTIMLVYAFGRLLGGVWVGVLSAALFTCSELANDLARTATVDAFLGVWCALAFLGMALWLRGRPRGQWLAALGIGLAVATKLNAATLLLPFLVIAYMQERSAGPRELHRAQKFAVWALAGLAVCAYIVLFAYREALLALAATWSTRGQLEPAYISLFYRLLQALLVPVAASLLLAVGVARRWRVPGTLVATLLSKRVLQSLALIGGIFVLTSPFVILDFPAFARDFLFQLHKSSANSTVAYEVGSRSYQAAQQALVQHNRWQYFLALRAEWGWPTAIMMPLGAFALWRSFRAAAIPFLLFCVTGLAISLGWSYLALRWLYPLWPLLVCLAAIGFVYLGRLIVLHLHGRWLAIVTLGLAAALLLATPVLVSFRSLQQNYLLPDTRSAGLAWLRTHLPAGTVVLREFDAPGLELVTSDYRVYVSSSIFEDQSLAKWQEMGVTTVVLEGHYLQFYKQHSNEFADVLQEYQKLASEWHLAASFEPGATMRDVPIYIYTKDSLPAAR